MLIWALLAVGSVPQPVRAGEGFTYPPTAAGEMARLYLDALNSGNEEALREFTLAHRSRAALERRPLESRLAQYAQIFELAGRLTPRAVTASSDLDLTLVAFSENLRGYFALTFTLEPDPPHKLDSISFRPTSDPGESETRFGEWRTLRDLLEQALPQSRAPAIGAAVAGPDSVLEVAVVGFRERGGAQAVEENDRFHFGSVAKSMTATAVGQLVQQGILDPDAPLPALLPQLEVGEAYGGVTLRHLLEHRSGLPAYTISSESEEEELRALPGGPREQRAAFAARVLAEDPDAAPGIFSYSNAGYALIAHLMEERSGESWEDLLQRSVLEPLGMRTVGSGWPARPDRRDEPRGHRPAADSLIVEPLNAPPIEACLAPAGDLHGSVGDLCRYARAHLRGLLRMQTPLGAETIQWLHTPTGTEPGDTRYAGGWMIRGSGEEAIHWHAGSAGSFYALVELDPAAGLAGVVVMNSGSLGNEALARRILEAYKERREAALAEEAER